MTADHPVSGTAEAPRVLAAKWEDRGDTFWFASLDGELWLCVGDDPTGADPEEVARLFNPPGKTQPMRITREFLEQRGAEFL